jgi:hypothetical protein
VVHPGHAAGLLALLAGGSVTLLTTAGPPAGNQDQGYRQEQRERPRLHQKRLQDNPLFV